jgi:ATP-dependent Clp protease ATP-binding subunit ClpB
VSEPTVEQTIAILRGSASDTRTSKGEVQDAALVAAAILSHRYLPDRQLPDKAIDPWTRPPRASDRDGQHASEIDTLERRRRQLEIERLALKREGRRGQTRRAHRQEIAETEVELKRLKEHWEREKAAVQKMNEGRARMEALRTAEQQAEREGDLERVARIRHGEMPRVRKQLDDDTAALAVIQKDLKLLKEEVDEEDIAEVVARWSGIPVQRLLESELAKLLHMEERLTERVVGQDQAVRAVGRGAPRGSSRPTGLLARSLPRPDRHRQDRAGRALAEFLFDDSARWCASTCRVPGEAHGRATDRVAAGLRRLRGRRTTHRGGARRPTRSSCSTRSKAHADVQACSSRCSRTGA